MYEMLILFLVGLFAQLVDGALGMAYGVISNSFLLSMGLPPAISSATVHTSEIGVSLTSGISHLRVGNVDKRLVKKLVLTGVVFAILGATFCSLTPVRILKPLVTCYLLVVGVGILWRAFTKRRPARKLFSASLLGSVGGYMDAVGGGGWGPVVTSSLVFDGHNPRIAIGSVNFAEFFVTIAQVATFTLWLGWMDWSLIIPFMAGGMMMAPFAAHVCARVPRKALMVMVGVLIVCLSIRNIILF